jgi:hypothetical protein
MAVFVGGLGLAALLRRRRATPVESSPADELRSKLAESRAAEEPEAGPEGDLDARRREVHEKARQSLDELG